MKTSFSILKTVHGDRFTGTNAYHSNVTSLNASGFSLIQNKLQMCLILILMSSLTGFAQTSTDKICFRSSTGNPNVSAKIEWTIDQTTKKVVIRTTFAKTFVDNTYGNTAVGWPNGHTFNNLVGSDHVQLALYDKNGSKKLEFKQDYISASSTVPSGYKSLGVTGGEGKMVIGNASSVLGATTSLDVNFNTHNYVLTTNSPSTDLNYTPNPQYPNWIYEVWYETTVDLNAFGSAGFGTALITAVHASPSKTGNNTEAVDSMRCPTDLSLKVEGNCIRDCSEDIISTVTGNTPPFSYLWSNGVRTKDLLNVCAGTYSLTVTDANNKTLTASIAVKDDECPGDQICFFSSTGDDRVGAKIFWTINQTAKTVTIRTNFAKTFVDNTYGNTAVGWPNGHTFSNLVGSDHVQLALFDKNGVKKLEFKQDYITASSAAPSGYKNLGVTGGEGGMILGSESSILAATSSLDVNFNTHGYVLTTNSPATDANYSPNPSYPKWIYDVWYEVTVDLNVFGAAGFGTPMITAVHASPSKTGNNTEEVDSMRCIEPKIEHQKTIVGVTPLGSNSYQVEYKITVENKGNASGQYNLSDAPNFDNDITINSASYSSNASGNPANPGPVNLFGTGPWTLATNQTIGIAATQTFNIKVNVSVSFEDGIGDNRYDECGNSQQKPIAGEGLFNESRLDTNRDGIPDQRDTACADIPLLSHIKSLVGVTPLGLNTYEVVYKIAVENKGGLTTQYNLSDAPAFDNDITIISTNYSSDASGHPANPGPVNLFGTGPWTLATNQTILADAIQNYFIRVTVGISLDDAKGDNRYDECGNSLLVKPIAGEGLFNESRLDIDRDGITDARDTACADLPFIVHTKSLVGVTTTGSNTYQVEYRIVVQNKGGTTGFYSLADAPNFENDINIISANYNTNASPNPANPGPVSLFGTGPWVLASNQSIAAGGMQTFTLRVNVSINLEDAQGDNRYDVCGRSNGQPKIGEGLFNESRLDVNNDGIVDQKDTACADIPYLLLNKSVVSVSATGTNTFKVEYKITVENKGGTSTLYNLSDSPAFDNDVIILNANYTTNAIGNPGTLGYVTLFGTGPWVLATNQNINTGVTQVYNIVVNVSVNLEDGVGDNRYDQCQRTSQVPKAGEGLFNEARLDVNRDGLPDTRDSACADLPFLVHNKSIVGVTLTGLNTYQVEYRITVENKGGLATQYNLSDAPAFDNDIIISSASYTSNAPSNPGNPGPVALFGTSLWTLAVNQFIAPDATHTYSIRVNITINLEDASGDNRYDECGKSISIPKVGEGLFNESRLDINRDGITDQRDTACADIPYLVHSKSIVGVTPMGGLNNYLVEYKITVENKGGIPTQYNLSDAPNFDNDITMTSANYSSNASGHPANPGPVALFGTGPWTLATNQNILPGGIQSYNLRVNVSINLEDAQGDNRYDICGKTLNRPRIGEGLFNESRLDINRDGITDDRDTACADIPYLIHHKNLVGVTNTGFNSFEVTYRITVENLGGTTTQYHLSDAPAFDNDVNISAASYSTNAIGHHANPGPSALAGTGPWTLAFNQSIGAGIIQTYNLKVNVTLNLDDFAGDNRYDECGKSQRTFPIANEGLFNESRLDINRDGITDARDTACADLPSIIHTKTLVGITDVALNTYWVEYRITVENRGGVNTLYNLSDAPAFDNDITIITANYSTNAVGNFGNPGPATLFGSGPWTLATNQSIPTGGTHTYTLRVMVSINLQDFVGNNTYDACGETIGIPKTGEGLFNESRLDINRDGIPDSRDTACADLPYILHQKFLVGVVTTGPNTFEAEYKIVVENVGGTGTSYNLSDAPAFDNDVVILSANYSTDAPGNVANPGPNALAGTGPWTLAINQFIGAGTSQSFNLRIRLSLNLTDGVGDNVYDECGHRLHTKPLPGEGLFNESRLDVDRNGAIDARDTACADLPFILHEKSIVGVTSTGVNSFQVEYKITVENKGGVATFYNLSDVPSFDNDITITGANYSSNAPNNVGNPGPTTLFGIGPWTLAQNQLIQGRTIHTYNIRVNVTINLSDASGDNRYDECGRRFINRPVAGEGLFNESRLDIDLDGTPDQRDTACADLPLILHNKSIIGVTSTGINTFLVEYRITVENKGGLAVQYNLSDAPAFDNDINILNANYSSNATGNLGNPGPVNLFGTGPWTLATNQNIAAGATQTYNLKVNVSLNLQDASGDNFYTDCGRTIGIPKTGEGLFNESRLDINRDGIPDQRDTACADIPFLIHQKFLVGVTNTGANTFEAEYRIVVDNLGGAATSYNLSDAPAFDNDLILLSANYSTTATGHPANPGPILLAGTGPWTLATNQNIAAGATQIYTIRVRLSLNLNDAIGDNRYDPCGKKLVTKPSSGEGLFNESRLDVDRNGTIDQRDTACADVPYIVHNKSIVGVTSTGVNSFRVEYRITVENKGSLPTFYNLSDVPTFDNDITITGASYSTTATNNAGNPGPEPLFGIGPWILATNQMISGFGIQTYNLIVDVTINLSDAVGDNRYDECGRRFTNMPVAGEGLFNESRLDIDLDGTPDQRDTACADLPFLIHNKSIVGVTSTGINTFLVEYRITVENKGGLSVQYNLSDAPAFDNDINILNANYSSNATGNPGNPGPVNLFGTGPWSLATNQNIAAGATQTYNLRVNISLNLRDASGDNFYTDCGRTIGIPKTGEGLFNESRLDINRDGIPDQRDTACADIPFLIHQKFLIGVTNTGANTFEAEYRIVVDNLGGVATSYNLSDAPAFDNDLILLSANYSTTATGHPANPGPILLAGTGPWTLATNQNIAAGATQIYTIRVTLSLNLNDAIGDNRYDPCGKKLVTKPSSGEGLFNESRLDVDRNGTIDQRDTACADVPYIVHNKSIIGVTSTGVNSFRVEYRITVENKGSLPTFYNLFDAPAFDNDITITGASYSTTATNNAGNPGPELLFGIGPWILATNQMISGFGVQTYNLSVDVTFNLSDAVGDNRYDECGRRFTNLPMAGEGLFNESRLDVNLDGIPDQLDTACADLPLLIHNKSVVAVTNTGLNTFLVEYRITVENKGGLALQYNLSDAPSFDDDISILNANYSTNAIGNPANPGPSNLFGQGPWTLATNQSIQAGAIQTYNIRINVSLKLEDTAGDNIYDECGKFTNIPQSGEGLFNESRLDINRDGIPDVRDTACADLPYILHDKYVVGVTQTGLRTFRVEYLIEVQNLGVAAGFYGLIDRPDFDNDIVITGAQYSSNAPGNIANPGPLPLFGTGPWTLATNQLINGGTIQTYSLFVDVEINLEDQGTGNNIYYECGRTNPDRPRSGEGLFNESGLDLNNDGNPDNRDTACADIPYISHNKTIISVTNTGGNSFRIVYGIEVRNAGGAFGEYDLTDMPAFDDDVEIISAYYSTTAPFHIANPGPAPLFGNGPWFLANDQFIASFSSQFYTLTVEVEIDLTNPGSVGDEIMTKCGTEIPGVPIAGEGLFNESLLDVNNDGEPDQRDSVCTTVDRGGLGDTVWTDLDVDGVQDPGEPGVRGAIAILYDCASNAIVRRDTTDHNGFYFFDNLETPKNYYVKFDLSLLPSGFGFTLRDKGGNDSRDSDVDTSGVGPCTRIDNGERDSTYDAGLVLFASLGDFVWHDRNTDGMQTAGEEGVEGVPVTLYNAANGVAVKTTLTNSHGFYLFSQLMPGNYYVKFIPPSGYTTTLSNIGADFKDSDVDNSNGTNTTAVTQLSFGEDDRTWDLGLVKCITISGDVWFDSNKDGIFDFGEKGINGLNVYLVEASTGQTVAFVKTVVRQGTPSDDGFYEFKCVKPGMYFLRFERPGQLIASQPYMTPNQIKDSDITHENGVNTTRTFVLNSGDALKFIGAGFQIRTTLDNNVDAAQDESVNENDNHFSENRNHEGATNSADKLNVYIYPNPVSDVLKIDLEIPQDGDLEIAVLDLNGRLVLFAPFNEFKVKGRYQELLEMSGLTTGQYILQIKTTYEVINKKITVSR